MLDAHFFTANRAKLKKALPKDALIVLTANGQMQRTGDTTYPFRQDNNFFYLTGLPDHDLILVMSGSEEFIILPGRGEVEEIFGGLFNRDNIAKNSGVLEILSERKGWQKVNKLRQNRKTIYTLMPPPVKISGIESMYTNGARRKLTTKLRRLFPDLKLQDLRPEFRKLRQVKSAPEIAAIKEAIAITNEGFQAAWPLLKTGESGNTVSAELDRIFRRHGVVHAWPPLVISGEDTCIIHASNLGRTFQAGDLVLIDIGAESENYAADISRTVVIGKAMSPRQQAVYDAVKRVQAKAIAFLRPGVSWREYIVQVDSYMGEELIKLGLIAKNERQLVRRYFPHAVSHSLGLDAHDTCDYAATIKENMVLAVEPGIYIKEEGIGIRIEDDVLITKTGATNLTDHVAYA